jgi:hypothetical protein
MSVGCAVKVDGEPCAVSAIGRCSDCKQPFCLSHQARTSLTEYTDLCMDCLAVRSRFAGKPRRERDGQLAVTRSRISEAVRRLRELGSPGLATRQVCVGSKKVWFGTVPLYDALSPAWPVPDCRWDWPEHGWTGGGPAPTPTGITESGVLKIFNAGGYRAGHGLLGSAMPEA